MPSNHFVNGSEVTSLQHRESAVMKPIRSHAFSKTTRSVPLQPRPYRQSPPPSKEISQVERHPSTATTGDAAASCNLDTLLREGVSERARLKIKNTREINEFVSTVYEKRKEAFRRCSAGEKDRCESPDHPVWETLGISEPERKRAAAQLSQGGVYTRASSKELLRQCYHLAWFRGDLDRGGLSRCT